MKKHTKRRWTATDVALAVYASRKGLTHKQIATLFDASAGAISNVFSRINNPNILGKEQRKVYNDGEVMAFQVQSGGYPDQQKYWNRRIGQINNIKYSIKEPEETEIEEPSMNDEELEKAVGEASNASIGIDLPVSEPKTVFSLNLTDEFILNFVKALRGK